MLTGREGNKVLISFSDSKITLLINRFCSGVKGIVPSLKDIAVLVGSASFAAFLQLLITVSVMNSARILIDFIVFGVCNEDFTKPKMLQRNQKKVLKVVISNQFKFNRKRIILLRIKSFI
tara:strand:- start:99 stop:458 length:360 start_codon:yes stop_codon:yes gene_type:complete